MQENSYLHPLPVGVHTAGATLLAGQDPAQSMISRASWALSSVDWGLALSCSLQVGAGLILFLCGAGWLWGAFSRHSAIEVVKRSKLRQAAQDQALPGVALVMPVKGCRHASDINWSTQLQSNYGGYMEFIFVVESERDPAFQAILQVIDRHGAKNARVLVAGFSATCSQKIHNLICGIQSCSRQLCSYVLCLDDDISLHPHSVAMLVQEMEDQPDMFLATGYPFDVPAHGSNLLSYCLLVFHLPLLIGFSMSERTHFVWGGCMLLRLHSLLDDRQRILEDWRDGGYSDDLIMASKCEQQHLKIGAPFHAVFPQRLPQRCSWSRYWNYLRRQLYVCDTYVSAANRRTNHCLLALHCALSLILLLGTMLVLRDSARLLQFWMAGGCAGSPPAHPLALDSAGDGSKLSPPLASGPAPPSLAVAVFFCCLTFAHMALVLMTGVVLHLFEVLSPRGPHIHTFQFSWVRVWVALLVESCVLPICTLYTLCSTHVDWSGVRYFRRRGKVVRVERV